MAINDFEGFIKRVKEKHTDAKIDVIISELLSLNIIQFWKMMKLLHELNPSLAEDFIAGMYTSGIMSIVPNVDGGIALFKKIHDGVIKNYEYVDRDVNKNS